MHELSLCRSIARIAEQHRQGRRLEQVGVRLGAFRQAVPEAMDRCWSVLTAGTALAGSTLAFEIVPLVVRCRICNDLTQLDEVWLRCHACDGVEVDVVAGDEFLVTHLELTDDDAGAATDTGASGDVTGPAQTPTGHAEGRSR